MMLPFRASRRTALESCSACRAPALPECQACLSTAIIRVEDITVCVEPECGFESYCPCGLGLDATPEDGDEEAYP